MIPFKTVKFASVEIQKAERLAPEVEEGNREYKFKLTDLTDDQLTHRITQLNWRLNEGNDEAFYLIGVEDNGNQLGLNEADLQESLRNLQFIADQVGCEMTVRQLFAGEQGTTAEVHMRRKQRITVDVVQVNVAVAGDLNSGKSTMIGVLSTGRLDNGKGLARMQVLTHNHEMESGTTSCISHHSLHFNKDGEVLNADPLPGMVKGNRLRALSDMELADEASRSVTLIDLAGHAKYLKTTLHGLIGRRPDLCIVCVSATTGLNSITTEHLGVCMYLNVPLVIVITKEDCVSRATYVKPKAKAKAAAKARNSYGSSQVPTNGESATGIAVNADDNTTANTVDAISRLVVSVQEVLAGSQRQSKLITNDAELVQHLLQPAESSTDSTAESSVASLKATVPIFTVSNVTGKGMQLLRSFLFQLPAHAKQQLNAPGQATCVRLLGSIGTINEREEVVFPRDEDEFSFKKPIRTRQYSLRYAPTEDNEGIAQNHKENSACLKTTSTSDDNLVAKEALHATYTAHSTEGTAGTGTGVIRRPHSSPDLASTTELSATQHSGEKGLKLLSAPEFSEYIESTATNAGGSGSDSGTSSTRDSPTSQAGANSVASTTGSSSRTKVLIGSIEGGKLSVGQALLLGPTCKGAFVSVIVSSLRLNNVPVCCASAGQTVTFKLSEGPTSAATPTPTSCEGNDENGEFRIHSSNFMNEGRRRASAAGLVLLSPDTVSEGSSVEPNIGKLQASQAHWEFEAELLVLNHPSKIRVNYEPVVHVGCVRQAAKLISVRKIHKAGNVGGAKSAGQNGNSLDRESGTQEEVGGDELGNGERGLCRFCFLYYPEFIISGEAMIIREQRTRGMGTITKLIS